MKTAVIGSAIALSLLLSGSALAAGCKPGAINGKWQLYYSGDFEPHECALTIVKGHFTSSCINPEGGAFEEEGIVKLNRSCRFTLTYDGGLFLRGMLQPSSEGGAGLVSDYGYFYTFGLVRRP